MKPATNPAVLMYAAARQRLRVAPGEWAEIACYKRHSEAMDGARRRSYTYVWVGFEFGVSGRSLFARHVGPESAPLVDVNYPPREPVEMVL